MAREVICGIYKITNLVNGKMYIGLSTNIAARWNQHKSHYKKGDTILYKAMIKYGFENFIFEIVELCPKEKLGEMEKFYIKKYRTYVGFKDCKGYNATLGGEDSEGLIFTEEAKAKMSSKRRLGNNPAAKKVYIDDKVFGTIKEAAQFLNIPSKNLQRWLSKERKIPKSHAYLLKHKIGIVGEPPLEQEYFGHETPVECDDIIFNSVKECAEYLNISDNQLISYLKGRVCIPEHLKNRGLKYVNKETSLRTKEKSWYQNISFLCDGQEFENISQLRDYLNCPISSLYNPLHNKNNGNIFIYKGKEIMWKEVDYNS